MEEATGESLGRWEEARARAKAPEERVLEKSRYKGGCQGRGGAIREAPRT